MIERTWKVGGMSCAHCVKAVTKALEGLGAKNVVVELSSGAVRAETIDANTPSKEQVAAAIAEAGYSLE